MKRQSSVNRRKIVRNNTQSSASKYVGETLPNDLIIEILSRLPATSIAICRCVSKQWASLLQRPDFSESFLTSSLSRPRFLFASRIGSKWHFFSSPQPRNFGEKSVVATEYHHMGYSTVMYKEIFQSVNGFIYLKNHIKRFKGKINTAHVICNPCTGQHITLPQLGEKNSHDLRMFLGYDPIGKQFKVLCILMTEEYCYSVLTLGTGEVSWRKIECSFLHYPEIPYNKGICIDGVLYYIVSINIHYNTTRIIACFDVRSEKFSFIEIEEAMILSLINYKGKLGVILCFHFGSILAEVWVLDDAKKVKWSKHMFVKEHRHLNKIKSIWVTDTGEMAWSSRHWTNPSYIFYYNLERQSVRRVEIKGIQDKLLLGRDHRIDFFTFTNHVENLMFL